jgi:hypothetical protein
MIIQFFLNNCNTIENTKIFNSQIQYAIDNHATILLFHIFLTQINLWKNIMRCVHTLDPTFIFKTMDINHPMSCSPSYKLLNDPSKTTSLPYKINIYIYIYIFKLNYVLVG